MLLWKRESAILRQSIDFTKKPGLYCVAAPVILAFCSDPCALADARHGFQLFVALSAFQKLNCMMQLTSGVFLWSALPEAGILSGNTLSCLGALHNHAPFVFSEGQHDCQNQTAGEGVFCQPHIQDVHPHTPGKSSLTAETPSIAVRAKRSSFVTTKVSPSCNF